MKLRMQITKEPEIRFISHLEYVRTIERAVRRAKLPAAYSEGFNPHLKFSLASALGVGVVSLAEFVEIELAEPMEAELAISQMRQALPRGIRIVAADLADSKATKLMAAAGGADYKVTLPYNDSNYEEALAKFNIAESVIYAKAAPKLRAKVKEINVKEYIKEVQAVFKEGELELTFACRITPEGSMKAIDLIKVLNENFNMALPIEQADITRVDLYRVNTDGEKMPMLDNIE